MSKLKKITTKLLILFLVLISTCFVFACGSYLSPTCKITFVEEGYPDIVIEVERGESLTEIPEVHLKAGYDIFWNTSDFSNITKDMVVYAVKYAKSYKLTYVINYNDSSFTENKLLSITMVSNYKEDLSDLEIDRLYYDVNTGEYFQVCIYNKYFKMFTPSDGFQYNFVKWVDTLKLKSYSYDSLYFNNVYGTTFYDKIPWKHTKNISVTAIYLSNIHN